MDIVRHATNEGVRHGVILSRGRKWMKIHYVAHATATKLPLEEERFMRVVGPMTSKQKTRFNKSVVAHGGKRGTIK